MQADDAVLLALADAVLDGRSLEPVVAGSSASPYARDLIPQFQVVAELRALGRSLSVAGSLPRDARSVRTRLPSHSTWGPLTILEPIGFGSFGDVYRAQDPRLDRPVALKLLGRDEHPRATESAVVDEARLMAKVRHPNVVTVYGAERIEDRVGIWMEFVDGRSLEEELQESGPMPAAEVVRVGIDLCGALAAIHRAGLLHRDLKAQNVLRDRDGRLVVTDFGAGLDAARADTDQHLAGTPLYLAPEILTGRTASVQSDLYSLGVLLFHLLTLGYPVAGRTLADIRAAHRRGDRQSLARVRADLDRTMVQAIERALEPQPVARYTGAREMEGALAALVAAPRGRHFRAGNAVALLAGAALVVSSSVLVQKLWPVSEVDAEAVSPVTPRKVLLPAGQIYLPAPDARTVAYIDTNERAQIWDLVKGRPLNLTREESAGADADPVVAPDGRRIAFASWLPDDTWELRLLGTGATVTRPLIARQSAFRPQPLDWSRDGVQILCWLRQKSGSTDLVLVPADGDRLRILHTFTGVEPVSARLSPDGRFVAATIGVPTPDVRTDVVMVHVDSDVSHVLHEGVAPESEPAWTPDGGRVFFLKASSETAGSRDGWEIPVADGLAAGEARLATRDLGNVSWVHLADDGLIARPVWTTSAEVYTRSIDLTGHEPAGPPVRIAADQVGNHGGPSWSPDGRWLAHFTTRPPAVLSGNPVKILTVSDMGAGTRREIATPLFFLGGYAPRWWPDGQSVLVWGSDADRTDRYGFYRVDLDSGRTAVVMAGGEAAPLSDLSPDGRVLYYTQHDRGLVSREIDSGRERVVVDAKQGGIGAFRVAPDGRAIAYTRRLPAAQQAAWTLVVQETNGRPRELLRVTMPDYLKVHAWTPDGQGILFTRATGDQPHQLWLMPVDGGGPIDLQARFIRSGSSEPNGLSLHPDGRQIAYPERVVQSELWLTAMVEPRDGPAGR